MRRLLAILTASLSLAATAQTAPDAPVLETPPAVESAPAISRSTEEVGLLQGRLDALEGQFSETNAFVDTLRKIKLSGYIQGRFTDTQGATTNGFSVRRGRFKATYTNSWSSYVLQIDAVPTGVTLKDAEAHFIEPWTGQRLELVVGQTKWPFGYEVVQSSGDREFPERTRVVRAFAPNERDRGAKLIAKFGPIRATLGAFDGDGTQNVGFVGVDNDKNKDVIGQVRFDAKWITGGVSGWWGRTYNPAVSTSYDRDRIGADVQMFLDLLPIGGTSLKGEYIAGRTWSKSNVEQFGMPASGWYALLVQNFGPNTQLAVRYDHFDALSGTPDGVDAADPTRPLGTNSIGTLGLTAIQYLDDSLKASVTYEFVTTARGETGVDPRDNVLTVQLQAKF